MRIHLDIETAIEAAAQGRDVYFDTVTRLYLSPDSEDERQKIDQLENIVKCDYSELARKMFGEEVE